MRDRAARLWRRLPPRVTGLPWRWIALGTFAAMVVVLAVPALRYRAQDLAVRTVLFVASPFAPSVEDFESLDASTTIKAADGSVLAVLGEERREPVELDRLPRHVRQAVLAAEDKDFYAHLGIDVTALARAFLRNAQGNDEVQGGSTITQQLAKINYAGRERTFLRKFKELLYARSLEKRYTKERLLQRYFNQVYFGENAYGIAAAADTYFGITPEKLSVAQAAMLAGKIRSPEVLDPRKRRKLVQDRRDRVLESMRKNGWLSDRELAAAKADPMDLTPPTSRIKINTAPHFVEYVKREALTLDAFGGSRQGRATKLNAGGFTIETTLDPKLYDAVSATVGAKVGLPKDPTTAVATVKPGDGAILTLFSGIDFQRDAFDVSSQGARQTGSAMKPFVYLAALRAGIDPRSQFDSSAPQKVEGFDKSVRNYEGKGSGMVDLTEALVKSYNTVFAQLGVEVGISDVLRTAERAGLPEGIKEVPAVALGGIDPGVSMLDLANAFATFAAKGIRAQPYAIARVTDAKGRVVFARTPDTERAFEETEVGVLNAAMLQVVERGTGTAAAIGRPVAGKTGTTSDYKDAWFAGFVPQASTAVWLGYPDGGETMKNVHGRRVTGGSFPAQIFHDAMTALLEGVKVEPIFTALPEDLGLRILNGPATTVESPGDETDPLDGSELPVDSTSSSSSSSSSSTSSTSTTEPTTTTSTTEPTTTTSPPRTTITSSPPSTTSPPRTTTTTSPPPSSTTTTSTPAQPSDAPPR